MTWHNVRHAVPADEPVSIVEARAQCRVEHETSFDTELAMYISAARSYVEDYTGLTIPTREVTANADSFNDLARLPAWPVIQIDAIKYTDEGGNEQTLDPANYVLLDISGLAAIIPNPGDEWPAIKDGSAIKVTFQAGYVAGAIPPSVNHAIRLLIGNFFEKHEVTRDGGRTWLDSLLCNHRRWGFAA